MELTVLLSLWSGNKLIFPTLCTTLQYHPLYLWCLLEVPVVNWQFYTTLSITSALKLLMSVGQMLQLSLYWIMVRYIPYRSTSLHNICMTLYIKWYHMQIPVTLLAKCERPQLMPVCTTSCSTDSVPAIVGIDDNDIPVEGNTITFSCPPGLELIGPNSATCTGNGEWGPDLSGLMCNDSVSAPMCNNSNSKFFVHVCSIYYSSHNNTMIRLCSL
jgi:hypothetical protein